MSGKDFQEEAVLAAVKPLKAANLSQSPIREGSDGATSIARSSYPRSMAQTDPIKALGLEVLFRDHHDRVFRTAHRVTGSPADAEDVLQTVFLRMARGSESIGVAENPQAYFVRAAINASLDLLRSRKRARAVAMDDVENEMSTARSVNGKTPETNHEDRELRNLVRVAVSKLGPTAAQMFTLRYFEGYANGEIATIMKTSPLVVGVTLHRARARLRKEIGRYLRQAE
jgi:RNA polymerase sigma-70 factor (ECF subfamily)